MKSPLVLLLSLAPLACAGAEPAPVAPAKPVGPAVVVDLTAPPVPSPAEASKPATAAEATPAENAEGDPQEPSSQGVIGLLGVSPKAVGDKAGAKGGDPLGAQGNLWGSEVGEAFGAGGLGLSGLGGGGRGEGIGLGSVGTLGHGAGTGQGFGYGSGQGRLGGHRGKPPLIRMGATTVNGRLPPEVIQRIVRQNFGRFRLCYENGLRNKPKLQGRISIHFLINPDGSVGTVNSANADLPDAGVISCVTRAFHGLSFPQPEGGKVDVVYPIHFLPGEEAKPEPSGTAPIKVPSTTPTSPSIAPARKP